MIDDKYKLTEENLMRTLPPTLREDEGMNKLGQVIAYAIAKLIESIKHAKVYPRIDELDVKVLDILAQDFDVYWYNYNYSETTKRQLIKDSFYIHRYLGTKGATVKALSDVYPNSAVLEWWEYGGEPYCFRVILDVSSTAEAVDVGLIDKTIKYYKSFRSHLEDDNIVIRLGIGIKIRTSEGGTAYRVPKAGIIPVISTRGDIESENIDVNTKAATVAYKTPKSGERVTGTFL